MTPASHRLQQVCRVDHVVLYVLHRIREGAGNDAGRRKVHNRGGSLQGLGQPVGLGEAQPDEPAAPVDEVLVAVAEVVQDDDLVALVSQEASHVGPDETRAPGDDDPRRDPPFR